MSSSTSGVRIERDSMGEVPVAESVYYGAQTKRAIENFPISALRFSRAFIRAIGIIKLGAARVNTELGLLDRSISTAIEIAAQEVIDGKLDDNFVLDVFQTGSGTSTNMNANEVIAGRANELLTGRRGGKSPVHPNDHVNLGQSSNDVIPTAIHVSVMESTVRRLAPALHELQVALAGKAEEFDRIIKIGRTHLMDATPIRLGQEFSGYTSMIEHARRRLEALRPQLGELAIGGTAIGTGMNTHAEFGRRMVAQITKLTEIPFVTAPNYFEALAGRDAAVEVAGVFKTVAVSLTKIANDIRWLGSGPRCGFGEILLPEIQPGSSIMPGKVNPVLCESLVQVCAHVVGNDASIVWAAALGSNFELNVMMPLIAFKLLESAELLTNACSTFAKGCVTGIRANRERCAEQVERSLAMCTALVPDIGYDEAAKIARIAYESNRTVREVAQEHPKFRPDPTRLANLLDPWRQTGEPGISI